MDFYFLSACLQPSQIYITWNLNCHLWKGDKILLPFLTHRTYLFRKCCRNPPDSVQIWVKYVLIKFYKTFLLWLIWCNSTHFYFKLYNVFFFLFACFLLKVLSFVWVSGVFRPCYHLHPHLLCVQHSWNALLHLVAKASKPQSAFTKMKKGCLVSQRIAEETFLIQHFSKLGFQCGPHILFHNKNT